MKHSKVGKWRMAAVVVSMLGGGLIAAAIKGNAFSFHGESSEAGTAMTAEQEEAFWRGLGLPGGEWVYSFDKIAEMKKTSDVVVTGRFTDFRPSRVFQGDAPEDIVVFAAADVEVTSIVKGTPDVQSIPVEFIIPLQPEDAALAIDEQAARLPEREMVLFLLHKGKHGKGVYELAHPDGLWIEKDGALATPLADHEVFDEHGSPNAESEPPVAVQTVRGAARKFAGELGSTKSIEELKNFVAQL
jgi:hypothetical protein